MPDDGVSDDAVPDEQPDPSGVEHLSVSEIAQKVARLDQIATDWPKQEESMARRLSKYAVYGDIVVLRDGFWEHSDCPGARFYRSGEIADHLKILGYEFRHLDTVAFSSIERRQVQDEVESAQGALPTARKIGLSAYSLFALAPAPLTAAAQAGPGALVASGVLSAGIATADMVATTKRRKRTLAEEADRLRQAVRDQLSSDDAEVMSRGVFVPAIDDYRWRDEIYGRLDDYQRDIVRRYTNTQGQWWSDRERPLDDISDILPHLIEADKSPSEYWEMIQPLMARLGSGIERLLQARQTMAQEEERLERLGETRGSRRHSATNTARELKQLNSQISDTLGAIIELRVQRDELEQKRVYLERWIEAEDEDAELPDDAKKSIVRHSRLLAESLEVEFSTLVEYHKYMSWAIKDYATSGIGARTYYDGLKKQISDGPMPSFEEFEQTLMGVPTDLR
jgi:hypothetical protein